MIYDAVQEAYTVASTNFTADLTALAAAKGVTVTATCTFIMRQKAETFLRLGAATPACGVYVERAATQAKWQSQRDSVLAVVFDYYATGSDPVVTAKQVELAAEALMQSVDRLAGAGAGVFGAGEEVGSVTVEVTDGFQEAQQPNWWRRAIVRFPLNDRDTGL